MSGLQRMHGQMVGIVYTVGTVAWSATVVAALLAVVVVPSATRAEEPPAFSGPRAFAHLEMISGLGPRPSG